MTRDEDKCVRCGISDGTAYDCMRGDWRHDDRMICIGLLRERLATVDAERDQFASLLFDCENERDGLRDKLAEVEESREILKAYYDDAVKVGTRCATIIAALREPSEAVVKAAVLHYSGDLRDAIRAAVAAAEREVTNA